MEMNKDSMMDFTRTCFWCGVEAMEMCGQCNLVGICGENHLNIHRPSGSCLPFAVQHSDEKGHLLVAVRDIKPYEIVLTDQPAAIGPFPGTCLACSASLPQPFYQCSRCDLPLCGPSCEEGQMHLQECQMIQKTENGEREDAVDVFSAVGVIRMLKKMRDHPEVMDMVLRLMDHLEERRAEEIWTDVTGSLVPWITSHGFGGIEPELVERIVGIIRTNSVKWTAGSGQPLGYAVCPVYSVLNHSCVNNTTDTQTQKGEIIVRATMLIRQGEEIFTQYRGPTQGNVLRRQDFLEYWKFSCTCPRCSDPTELGTMASAMKCEECGATVLPASSAIHSDWVCGGCGKEEPARGMVLRVRRMQQQLDLFSPAESPEAWEALLSQFQTELHEDHFLCMNIKRVLLTMYGAREGYRMEQLPRLLIDRKIELCRNYVAIFSRLEPGFRQWRGEVLEEMVGPLTVCINQDMENNNLSQIQYIKKIKEVIGLVKEAAKCRQFEETRKDDKGLYQALEKSFKANI
eukprot:GFUD01019828.1.p1 GENE.GFUD01019828.1~~GFUD01019828.1.p1  ORF type:complete len:515 (+),score=161.30 GFUD01019828.1:38-1582(+)